MGSYIRNYFLTLSIFTCYSVSNFAPHYAALDQPTELPFPHLVMEDSFITCYKHNTSMIFHWNPPQDSGSFYNSLAGRNATFIRSPFRLRILIPMATVTDDGHYYCSFFSWKNNITDTTRVNLVTFDTLDFETVTSIQPAPHFRVIWQEKGGLLAVNISAACVKPPLKAIVYWRKSDYPSSVTSCDDQNRANTILRWKTLVSRPGRLTINLQHPSIITENANFTYRVRIKVSEREHKPCVNWSCENNGSVMFANATCWCQCINGYYGARCQKAAVSPATRSGLAFVTIVGIAIAAVLFFITVFIVTVTFRGYIRYRSTHNDTTFRGYVKHQLPWHQKEEVNKVHTEEQETLLSRNRSLNSSTSSSPTKPILVEMQERTNLIEKTVSEPDKSDVKS